MLTTSDVTIVMQTQLNAPTPVGSPHAPDPPPPARRAHQPQAPTTAGAHAPAALAPANAQQELGGADPGSQNERRNVGRISGAGC